MCGLNDAKQLAAQNLKVVRIAQGGAPEGLVVPLVAGGPHSRVSQGRSVLVGWDRGSEESLVPYLRLADAQCEVQVWSEEEEEGLAGPTLYVNGSLRLGGAKVPALASIPLHHDLARQGLLQAIISCVCVCVCVCVCNILTHVHIYISIL